MNKKIDVDFNAKRRDEVFAHLYQKYGKGFAHIGTHGALQVKNAFKDVCRIFNVPFQDSNLLSSLIPDDAETISDALSDSKFLEKINENPILRDVIKYSEALEGTIKSYGVHACIHGNTPIVIDGKKMSIEEAYCLANDSHVKVLTSHSEKHCLIHKTDLKTPYVLRAYTDSGNEVSSLVLSCNHKVYVGNGKYEMYKFLPSDRPASYYPETIVPSFVSSYFVAGMLTPFISKCPLSGKSKWEVDAGTIKNIFDYLETVYDFGEREFHSDWGRHVSNPTYLNDKIGKIMGLININGSILPYGPMSKVLLKLSFSSSELDFVANEYLHGLFSSLYENAPAENHNFFFSNLNGFKKKTKYYLPIYSLSIASIIKEVNKFLSFCDVQIPEDLPFLALKDFEIVKYAGFREMRLQEGRLPRIKLVKGGKVKAGKVQMYDVQILTSISLFQNFNANGLNVSNCGIVLSDSPLDESIPLFAVDGLPVTMYDGGQVEKLSYIKVDILGVKVLSIIDECLNLINSNPNYQKIRSVYDLPLDDKKAYELYQNGDTLGTFQTEGQSVSPSVPLVAPENIHDIAAILAIWRPGPLGMSYDKMFIDRKHNPDASRDFYIPRYNHIFEKTYGLGIYQEQYMILLQEMCGFDPIKTDVWRKGVGRTIDFYFFL